MDAPRRHHPYGQLRFRLTDECWLTFSVSERPWPCLHVPVWRYAAYGTWITAPTHLATVTRPRTGQWALESIRLYQHLHFTQLYVMRYAPNVTSSNAPLHYRLPRAINEAIVDQLTTRQLRRRVRLYDEALSTQFADPVLDHTASFALASLDSVLTVSFVCAPRFTPLETYTPPPDHSAKRSSASMEPLEATAVNVRWERERDTLNPCEGQMLDIWRVFDDGRYGGDGDERAVWWWSWSDVR